ncbi:hypothetical protein [Streptomyces sp. NPDC003710]
MHALPPQAARELRRLVKPLDDLYIAKTWPDPFASPDEVLRTTGRHHPMAGVRYGSVGALAFAVGCGQWEFALALEQRFGPTLPKELVLTGELPAAVVSDRTAPAPALIVEPLTYTPKPGAPRLRPWGNCR